MPTDTHPKPMSEEHVLKLVREADKTEPGGRPWCQVFAGLVSSARDAMWAERLKALEAAVETAHNFVDRDASYVFAEVRLPFESQSRAVGELAELRRLLRAALASKEPQA